MVGTYAIKQGTGTVNVEREGLYYRFSCRCSPDGAGMHRLVLLTDGGRVDLGVCVPVDGCFGVDKRVPCKRVGEGSWEFHLLPKHEKMQGRFVPVYPEEPFAYLEKLKGAYLATQNAQVGIVLAE